MKCCCCPRPGRVLIAGRWWCRNHSGEGLRLAQVTLDEESARLATLEAAKSIIALHGYSVRYDRLPEEAA